MDKNKGTWLYYKSYPMSSTEGTERLNKCIDILEKNNVQYWMGIETGSYIIPGTSERVTDNYCTLGVKLADIFRYPDIRVVAARNKKRVFIGSPAGVELRELHYKNPGLQAVVSWSDGVTVTIKPSKWTLVRVTKNKGIDIGPKLRDLGFNDTEVTVVTG